MKLYLIPGFRETLEDKGYKKILNEARAKGYEGIFLNLQLGDNSISEKIEELVNTIKPDESAVVGFSTGALITYLVASRIPIKKALFCSISDIIGEDTQGIVDNLKNMFGENTTNELGRLDYTLLKSKESYFLNGDKEKYTTNRVEKLLSMNKEAKHIIVENTEHELNDGYVSKIIELL